MREERKNTKYKNDCDDDEYVRMNENNKYKIKHVFLIIIFIFSIQYISIDRYINRQLNHSKMIII
jgi:hypothetical protein